LLSVLVLETPHLILLVFIQICHGPLELLLIWLLMLELLLALLQEQLALTVLLLKESP
jgi:hypothetical protein